jgi:hypothetical protein
MPLGRITVVGKAWDNGKRQVESLTRKKSRYKPIFVFHGADIFFQHSVQSAALLFSRAVQIPQIKIRFKMHTAVTAA